MITHLFFDLDNTLYPKSSRLLEAINDRITEFTASYLDISVREAERMRMNRGEKYSTTYQWLVDEHGFKDIEDYMDVVHPKDLTPYLKPDIRLHQMLSSIHKRCFILTNSPMEHAERVLDFLEIRDCFEHIFDLRGNGFIGKPDKKIVASNLDRADVSPGESLLIDDAPANVISFIEMGGYGVLVDEDMSGTGPLERISTVLDLNETYIESLEGKRFAVKGGRV